MAEGSEAEVRDEGGDRWVQQRTKSSVRRAREFKQFDEVNLLDVDAAGEGFELLGKGGRKSTKDANVLSDSTLINTTSSLSAKKKSDSAAGATTRRTAAGPKADTAKEGRLSTRTGRSLTTYYRSATGMPHTSATKKSSAAAAEVQELKEEMAKLRQALLDKDDIIDKHAKEVEEWKMEKEGLLSGMRSGGREVDRITASLAEMRDTVSRVTEERDSALARIKELESSLANVVAKESQQSSSRMSAEANMKELRLLFAQKECAVKQLKERVQCAQRTNQELSYAAEMARLEQHLQTKAMEGRVGQLTAVVEKLTLNMQKEQGMSQTARRSLEAVEAVNKRIEAEKTRLEATIQAQEERAAASESALPSERSFNSPGSMYKPAPNLAPAGTDELWNLINELESSKKEMEAAHGTQVEDLKQNILTMTADKEALWLECERLSRQVEELQDELREQETSSPFAATETPQCVPPLGAFTTSLSSSPQNRTSVSLPSTRDTDDASERRCSALQQARNARKSEVSTNGLSRQQSIAFDSIMDEVGAMKKSSPIIPTPR